MGFKGSFSYKTARINDTIWRETEGLALAVDKPIIICQFVDRNGQHLLVPDGINGGDIQHPIINAFGIAWFESYKLFYNGREVLSIVNQKQLAFRSTPRRGITGDAARLIFLKSIV